MFNANIFNESIFNMGGAVPPTPPPVVDVKTGAGGIEAEARRRSIVKPTGLLHVPRKDGRKDIAERIEDSRQIEAEVADQLAREFTEEIEVEQKAIAEMTALEIDREIGILLRKKLQQEEDEMAMLLMLAAIV